MPSFESPLQYQTILLNNVLTYQLPPFTYPISSDLIAITVELSAASSFVTVDGHSLVIQPKTIFQVGDFNIFVVLTDPTGIYIKVPFNFTVVEPPKFAGKIVKRLDLMASN